ncbi:MAG: TolC family outer membrane protein [Colwellia sp.]
MSLKFIPLACLMLTQPAIAITLEESIAYAIDNNPLIKQQYARYESFVRDRDAAESDFYPTVNLSGAVGYEDTQYNSGDFTDEQLIRKEIGIKVTQNIFNGYADVAEVDRLAFDAESERLGLLSDAENLALEVARIYLDLLKATQFIELTERNVEDHEGVLTNIKVRHAQGLSSTSDLAQISARVATAKSSLIVAQNNLLDKRIEYLTLVGVRPEALVEPKVDAQLLPGSEKESVSNAIQYNPEIRIAIADLNAASHEVTRESASFYPEVNLELHGNLNHDLGGNEGRDSDARIMLTMSYDIYSGGHTVSKKESAIWRKEEARTIRLRTEQQVSEGVRLAWNSWSMQQQQLGWLQKNVDAAKQAEIGYIEQFKLNRRGLLDVLQVKVELFTARKNYIETFYNQRFASYRLLNATGQLGYAMRLAYPEQWKTEVISNEQD